MLNFVSAVGTDIGEEFEEPAAAATIVSIASIFSDGSYHKPKYEVQLWKS